MHFHQHKKKEDGFYIIFGDSFILQYLPHIIKKEREEAVQQRPFVMYYY